MAVEPARKRKVEDHSPRIGDQGIQASDSRIGVAFVGVFPGFEIAQVVALLLEIRLSPEVLLDGLAGSRQTAEEFAVRSRSRLFAATR